MEQNQVKNKSSSKQDSRNREPRSKPSRKFLLLGAILLCIAAYAVSRFMNPGDTSSKTNGGNITTIDEADPRIPSQDGKSWQEIDDPTKDGWETEAFTNKAMLQLKSLGKLLTQPGKIDAATVENYITPEFTSSPILPTNLTTVLDDPHIKIERLSTSTPATEIQGAAGFADALGAAAAPFSEAKNVRFEVKIFRVTPDSDEITTRQYFAISGETESGTLEQHATWEIRWTTGNRKHPPRMLSLSVKEFEQSTRKVAAGKSLGKLVRPVPDRAG